MVQWMPVCLSDGAVVDVEVAGAVVVDGFASGKIVTTSLVSLRNGLTVKPPPITIPEK
jgi:hypothetical protein